ncbi:migration and invasion enhancer 1 [Plutella xylostella]|uniref:migration and invasion enhancer 1 n=1 Tax=Plutella xylostella TaxID=51655 RepID=UPI002032A1DF|nr:migration and invasion enhancer 1 [Plutella xylostella]
MSDGKNNEISDNLNVHVEYCGVCDYGGHCLALAKTIQSGTPNARVVCKRGRQGSFEVAINDKLVYSKLRTMALPDYEEVAQVVSDVAQGGEPREIKGEQPVNCVIS